MDNLRLINKMSIGANNDQNKCLGLVIYKLFQLTLYLSDILNVLA